jgi:hypothetical protein
MAKAKLEQEFRMHGQNLADNKQTAKDQKEESGEKVPEPADIKKTGIVGPDTPQPLEKA